MSQMSEKLWEVEEMARGLLDAHGLMGQGWHFQWSTRTAAKGDCFHDRKRIRLSRHFAKSRPLEGSRDTMIHEIAHALVGPGHGHGRVWKAQMRALGAADTTRTRMVAEHAPKITPKFVLCHSGTGEIFSRYQRKPTAKKWYDMETLFVSGRRAETKGKLAWYTWLAYIGDFGEPA